MKKDTSNENISYKYDKKDKNAKTVQKSILRVVNEKMVSEGINKLLYEVTQLNIKVEKLFDKSLELEKKNNSLEQSFNKVEEYFEKKLEKKLKKKNDRETSKLS
ncbi:hypothetical protein BpHYR1_013999 [Brachionus plicatilis]|uniref:Uncharacterized protein n=1 Tax=Brachionus plicatilis TaxID=10195 RepID=A0A3M7QUZ6_BRAPC|nr:hypothetical protein BpHYR1_013999 [Brachionus plicatilis]